MSSRRIQAMARLIEDIDVELSKSSHCHSILKNTYIDPDCIMCNVKEMIREYRIIFKYPKSKNLDK